MERERGKDSHRRGRERDGGETDKDRQRQIDRGEREMGERQTRTYIDK